ncbi:type II toxin-antitoxin system MqsR family toxin [Pantoea sp. App145]|uniref:type II toxin-antitoxin system MqsR family toxin n=1 Tax=Pantoea sp. App145 TaxID=3071567 RepID=UPI003A7F8D33
MTSSRCRSAITDASSAANCCVSLSIRPRATDDFFKSMTAYDDHTNWHEVYRPDYHGKQIYLEFIVTDGVLIMSFKPGDL